MIIHDRCTREWGLGEPKSPNCAGNHKDGQWLQRLYIRAADGMSTSSTSEKQWKSMPALEEDPHQGFSCFLLIIETASCWPSSDPHWSAIFLNTLALLSSQVSEAACSFFLVAFRFSSCSNSSSLRLRSWQNCHKGFLELGEHTYFDIMGND